MKRRGPGGSSMISMTPQELEKLLKESAEIANDGDTYAQFRQKRENILKEFLPDEGLN